MEPSASRQYGGGSGFEQAVATLGRLSFPRLAFLLVCSTLSVATGSTARADPAPSPAWPIPELILQSGRNLLIERAGKDFFERYITLDSNACRPRDIDEKKASVAPAIGRGGTHTPEPVLPPRIVSGKPGGWMLAYTLRVPMKPWVRGNISFDVDSAGARVAGHLGFSGLSDCVHNPEECTFSIEQGDAEEAARRSSFKAGLTAWTVQFQWQAVAQPSSYAWVVSNTLYQRPDGCSGSGQSMLIDASTGKILTITDWDRICDFVDSPEKLPAENEFVYYEEAPVAISQVDPVPPEGPRSTDAQYEVLLHVLVGKDGRVKDVKVLRGMGDLNEAAVEAVKKWVFRPALSNNKPVAVWIEIPIQFRP